MLAASIAPSAAPAPDEGVDLVDEQDDVAAGADLLEDLLQALLEVTAVARPGDERAEVERVELLVLEGLGDLAADDRLGQALDDGGLADAGLADQHRVVLGAAAQHLHDPLDLLLAPDDRVELGLAGRLGEVAAELVEHQGAGRGVLRRGAAGRGRLLALVAGQQLDDLLADPVEVGAELDEDLGGDALALADEAEQDVLGPDVVVAELQRLAQAQLEDLLRPGGEGDVTARGLLALADDLLDLLADGVQRDAQGLQRLGRDAFALVDEAEQDVLGPDVVVVEHPGLFLGQDDNTTGAVGESLEHVSLPHERAASGRNRSSRTSFPLDARRPVCLAPADHLLAGPAFALSAAAGPLAGSRSGRPSAQRPVHLSVFRLSLRVCRGRTGCSGRVRTRPARTAGDVTAGRRLPCSTRGVRPQNRSRSARSHSDPGSSRPGESPAATETSPCTALPC